MVAKIVLQTLIVLFAIPVISYLTKLVFQIVLLVHTNQVKYVSNALKIAKIVQVLPHVLLAIQDTF